MSDQETLRNFIQAMNNPNVKDILLEELKGKDINALTRKEILELMKRVTNKLNASVG